MKEKLDKQKIRKILVRVGSYVFLGCMALVVLFPFYFMIISSLKTLEEYRLSIPTLWPEQFIFRNYIDAFMTANLGRLFLNTLLVGVVCTVISLIITVLTAFAFARLEFKGKHILFGVMLATMMIPGELFTITNYMTVSQLNWLKTFRVLIIPFLVSVFYIYYNIKYDKIFTKICFTNQRLCSIMKTKERDSNETLS